MSEQAHIFVAGHRGLVGSALVRRLSAEPSVKLVLKTRSELDLTNQAGVWNFFAQQKVDQVYLAAATVGGIYANDAYPANFIRDNLVIQSNVIDAAWNSGVKKLLFLGSSCIYPKHASQPISEDSLMTGPLEPTNQWYAVAKIAGLKMCQAYRKQYGFDAISVMPTNLYGPGDNFDPAGSHVLPALVRKFVEAVDSGVTEVQIWGSGRPCREFLHVDDLADACVFLMGRYSDSEPINVGYGSDVTIAKLAQMVGDAVGFRGRLLFDVSKPDGTPRKLLNSGRLSALGWRPRIDLEAGIRSTVDWYKLHRS